MRYALGLNNKALSFNSKTLGIDPYNPLGLPPYTLRIQMPSLTSDPRIKLLKGDAVQVSQDPNIWDIFYENPDWSGPIMATQNIIILGANLAGVTNLNKTFCQGAIIDMKAPINTPDAIDMSYMFYDCFFRDGQLMPIDLPPFNCAKATNLSSMFYHTAKINSITLKNTNNVTTVKDIFNGSLSLTAVNLFDTSNVTDMSGMFKYCDNLKHIPLFDTSKVINIDEAFLNCSRVESGALALYQQASTQANPPSSHNFTFAFCGELTQTGNIELHQIPVSWGGKLDDNI